MRVFVTGLVSRICLEHPYGFLAVCRLVGAVMLGGIDWVLANYGVAIGIILVWHTSQTYLISVGMSALTLRLSKLPNYHK